QIVAPVASQVQPGHAGSQLAQAVGQQGLTSEIIKGFVLMDMPQQVAGIGEPGLLGRRRFRRSRPGPKYRAGSAWRPWLGAGFVDSVKAIGLGIGDQAAPASTPRDLDGQVLSSASSKGPHRVVAGQVTATTNHFLGLQRNGTAADANAGADAAGVG